MAETQELRMKALSALLAAASGALQLRDAVLGVTKRLRRHPLAEDCTFDSHGRCLSAVFVPGEAGVPALLLCHGIGETVEHWSAVQALLRDCGVGSLVFNYSGYGRSEGSVTPQHCDEDFRAAYAELRRRVGPELPVFVLGFSLGSGIAAQGIGALQPQAAGLFLCEAFPSFREAVARVFPRWLCGWLPAIWQTCDNVRRLQLPVCVIHSTGDKLFPVAMAQQIVLSTGGRAELLLIESPAHNEPYLKAVDAYWRPVVERIRRCAPPS